MYQLKLLVVYGLMFMVIIMSSQHLHFYDC